MENEISCETDSSSVPLGEPTPDLHPMHPALESSLRDGGDSGSLVDEGQSYNTASSVGQTTLPSSSAPTPLLFNQPECVSSVLWQKYDAQQRERVKQVRRQGACLRCRIYKERCDLEVPCQKCREVLATAKLFKQPCEELSLQTIVAFRPDNSRASEARSLFPKLQWSFDDPQLRKTLISQDYSFKSSHPVPTMSITCRRFVPGPSDVLVEAYEASDGGVILTKSPPFACVDIDTPEMRGALEAYIKECRPFVSKDISTTVSDEIYKLGLLEAERFGRKREESIVSLALEILACTHVNFKAPIIVGSDTLDVTSINGTTPVPSVLDYQIDVLYIRHMHRLINKVSKRLEKLIFASNNTANWYEIFLTTFVLLVSLEQVYMAQLRYIRRNEKNIFMSKVYLVGYSMISEWRASAKNLLYHFRCVLKGMVPFSPSWDPKKQEQVELDDESLTYIQTMSEILGKRKAELSNLREEGLDNIQARPLAWLVELFLDD